MVKQIVQNRLRQKIASEHLEAVIDGLEDELLIIDRDYRIVKVNQAVLRRHGKALSAVVDKYCYEISHRAPERCCPPRHECPVLQVWETGRPSRATHVHTYGEPGKQVARYIDVIATPIHDDDGNIMYVAELLRDVTEARLMALRINEAHQNLLALNAIAGVVSQSLDMDTVLKSALDKTLEIMKERRGGILLWDEEDHVLRYRVHQGFSKRFVNGAVFRLGDGVAGLAAQTGKSILVEDIATDARCNRPELMKSEGLHGFASIPLVFKDRTLGVLNVASPEIRRFTKQDVSLLESIAAQITIALENARLHEEVQKQDRLRGELLARVFSIQEEERRRIARELHDETTQSLVGMATSLEAIRATLPLELHATGAKLKSLQSVSLGILDEMHRLIYELRPAMLDDFGLVAAVRSLVTNELKPPQVEVSFRMIGSEKRLTARLESTLFRVLQEAVNNISRHARATKVDIVLRFRKASVGARIVDNGRGFDVEEATNTENRPRGLGLVGMKERISLVNGVLKIQSSPGKGTEIVIEVPIGEREKDE